MKTALQHYDTAQVSKDPDARLEEIELAKAMALIDIATSLELIIRHLDRMGRCLDRL